MSNRHTGVQLDVAFADLPMVAYAIVIARTTARMCGKPFAAERLAQLLDVIKTKMPAAADIFDPYEFCELCAALWETPEWSAKLEPWPHAYADFGEIVVTIGKRRFCSERKDHRPQEGLAEAVTALLEEIAPTGEERLATIDNPAPLPVTPERAQAILNDHRQNFGREINAFMTKAEEYDIRQAWLAHPNGRYSMRDYLVCIAKIKPETP